jgi:putative spermidine/putrescine transport system permease protein
MNSQSRAGAWTAMIVGSLYFLIPLAATLEFSLRMRRSEYSFDAYRVVLTDPRFQASFGYSMLMAVLTIVVGVLLVVPTAYWVRLRLPKLRPVSGRIELLL